MKKNPLHIVVFLTLLCIATSYTGCSQNIVRNSDGNYISVSKRAVKDTVLRATGHTFTTAKGESFPVYMTTSGREYVLRVSKNTSKSYKQYLPK